MAQSIEAHSPVSPDPRVQQSSADAVMSDVALAQAAARAVREVPGVVELTRGRSSFAATYGPGQSVTGIVVQHLRPGAIKFDVHAIVSLPSVTRTAPIGGAGVATAARGSESPPLLIDLAEQIRGAVYRMAESLGQPALTGVDVFIDDLK